MTFPLSTSHPRLSLIAIILLTNFIEYVMIDLVQGWEHSTEILDRDVRSEPKKVKNWNGLGVELFYRVSNGVRKFKYRVPFIDALSRTHISSPLSTKMRPLYRRVKHRKYHHDVPFIDV